MRLIDADALLQRAVPHWWSTLKWVSNIAIDDAPTIDAISTDDVAEMLAEQFYDKCPCNYNNNDEWLPYVCELTDECPNPKDPLGCWKQYIKHYGRRPDAID